MIIAIFDRIGKIGWGCWADGLNKQSNECFVQLLTFPQVGWPTAKMSANTVGRKAIDIRNTLGLGQFAVFDRD